MSASDEKLLSFLHARFNEKITNDIIMQSKLTDIQSLLNLKGDDINQCEELFEWVRETLIEMVRGPTQDHYNALFLCQRHHFHRRAKVPRQYVCNQHVGRPALMLSLWPLRMKKETGGRVRCSKDVASDGAGDCARGSARVKP